jgi:hypothetical protein
MLELLGACVVIVMTADSELVKGPIDAGEMLHEPGNTGTDAHVRLTELL